ncbi:helix-turn-helix domain-containing protein [Corynebacterium hindlerae]|uniref:AlbA family DNA-binding domain-containing protein n=1 Tax=Corynebacterium hindlerae TaxID=699041 RepID=UPI001FCAAB02|nr:ATP-binding protein [Corynebacterium hindlerae]
MAFANAEGGLLAVGITDDGKVEEKLTVERENDLRGAAHNHTDPAVRLRIEKLNSVLLFHVEPGERVHFTKNGDCYLRLAEKSVK